MDPTTGNNTKKLDFSTVVLEVIKAIVFLWDCLTYPIYEIIYRRSERNKIAKGSSTKCIKQLTTDSQMVFESVERDAKFYSKFLKSHSKTLGDAWKWAVKTYRSKPVLGTREILQEEDEVQKSGRVFFCNFHTVTFL